MSAKSDLSYDRYPAANGEEWLMRIGAADAPAILILPPLLEELNRTRALIAAMMRGLAARGFGCWLPDFPGTGESERPLEACSWQDWQGAVASAAGHVAEASGRSIVVASLRGGCLLDGVGAACHWRFAPAEGRSLARDLIRSSLVAPQDESGPVSLLAGYPVHEQLLAAIESAEPAAAKALRTIRLESDRGEADHKIGGPALWRRSEPGNSPEMADALASDIAAWVGECGVS